MDEDDNERRYLRFEFPMDIDSPRFWEIVNLIGELMEIANEELDQLDEPFLCELERQILEDLYRKG